MSAYIGWKVSLIKGAGLFALSMLAALLFEYVFHFVIDSPDSGRGRSRRHRVKLFGPSPRMLNVALFVVISVAAVVAGVLIVGAHRWDSGTEALRARLEAARVADGSFFEFPALRWSVVHIYLVVVAGGHGYIGTKLGDAVIAYALLKDGPQ